MVFEKVSKETLQGFAGIFALLGWILLFIFRASFKLRMVNFLIDFIGSEQFFGSADAVDFTFVQNDDFVRILDGGDSLGDDDLGDVGSSFFRASRISASVFVSTALVESSKMRILVFSGAPSQL